MEQNALNEFIDDFSIKYYHENGNLPMFHIAELFIKKELDSNRIVKALNCTHPIFQNERPADLKVLANKLNISKERVRQIGQKYVKQLLNISFENNENTVLREVLNITNWSYIIKAFSDNVIISEESLLPFLDNEQSTLTPSFAIIVLGEILQKDFSIIGNNQYIKANKLRTYWKHVYLIRTNIVKCFDFNKFIKKAYYYEYGHNIYTLCNIYELVEQLFNDFWIKQEHTQYTRTVSLVVGAILIFELNKKIDAENRIAFTGRRIPITDIVYQLISDNNQGMSISELFKMINFIYAGRFTTSKTIIQAIKKDKRLSMVNKFVDKVL